MATKTTELEITGMTCASCAARIQKKLNKLPDVEAAVNYATEKAFITHPDSTPTSSLIGTVEKLGYGAKVYDPGAESVDEATPKLRRRLIVAIALAVPVIGLSMIPPLQFPGWQWLVFALTLPSYFWCGLVFHRVALKNLRMGSTTMDTLISMGTTAAMLWSTYALFFGGAGMIGYHHEFSLALKPSSMADIYFESVAGIIAFILIGRYMEARSKTEAGAAIRSLLTLGASDVTVLLDGAEAKIPIGQLAVGDEFVVHPGEKIATDGEVVSGYSAIDTAVMTGESAPVEVGPGSAVLGATLNADGRLVVRATRVGADTQLATMARLVEEAQSGKAHVQLLADKLSGVFVPVVIGIALVTLVVWLVLGVGPAMAISAAVAVLIIACPCALGLATPTALLVGTGRGAQLGVIIRGPQMLEQAKSVDTVVLDKTGTVTTGKMAVVSSAPVGVSNEELLSVAASVERGSQLPIAKAVAEAV
ncbi:MAG: heavy metal translocating P-type ATPase, partial [Propionibacteriaceae bacterium]|nr:heavy metal translocating P-type ATPase [Propionibacteriaceae bacterium]